MSKRQYDFMVESLKDLQNALTKKVAQLTIRVGDAETILKSLVTEHDAFLTTASTSDILLYLNC